VAALALAGPLAAQSRGPAPLPPGPAPHTAAAHALPSPTVHAAPRAAPITLDGRLDEPIWATVEPATDFRQTDPREGEPASQRTEIRILYDDQALYLGARMFDSLGAAGVRTRLVRRDGSYSSSDYIQFVFDTYHNHLGRTIFAVNPSGVKQDAGQASEFTDSSWDPVWEVSTAIDSLGWTAEFRIPFSQLRFARDSVQTWGMQVWRQESRLNETSMWSFWGKTETGGPSRFGHIEGLRAGRSSRRLELLPYVVGRALRLQPGDPLDPFYRQHATDVRAGGDLKYLLTSNLTLDATFNPDFGQVEVDPAVVNLTAFETFFPEKRPFFIEGGGTFGFGGFSCFFCSNVSSLSLFYTRRIGRVPQGSLPTGTTYSDVPDATTILGAAKATGRTRQGWTIGLLDGVTDRERAPAMVGGSPVSQLVEPYSNYFVGRLKKDFNRGNLVVGTMATSVYRHLNDSLLTAKLPGHAEALGFDWNARWKNRTYSFAGNFAFSNVEGSAPAILRLQNSSARYFQRPDRQHGSNRLFSDRFDPSATALRGFGGYARLAKDAGNWLFETATNIRSPGFEANDLGFNTRSDYAWMNANALRSWTKPTAWYRSLTVIGGAQQQLNFDGDLTDRQMHLYAGGQLRNYWWVNTFLIRRPDVFDDRLTRGGPVVKRPGTMFYELDVQTDSRKRVTLELSPSYSRTDEGRNGAGLGTEVSFKPASNVSLSFSPAYNYNEAAAQYVRAVSDPTATAFYGTRYVFSDLRQKSLNFDTRVNVTFTPTLTFELYAQPFISSVHYTRFKEFAAPRVLRKLVYGEDLGTVATTRNANGTITDYTIDPDGAGPAAAFSFENPDFTVRSLRGNAVVRWEYRPGSTLFFVWTRSSSDAANYVGDLAFSRDLDALFHAKADNVFLVKVNWWLNR
jgi:hypothetical protein